MVKRVRFPASQSAALERCPLQALDPASEHVWKDGFMEELLSAGRHQRRETGSLASVCSAGRSQGYPEGHQGKLGRGTCQTAQEFLCQKTLVLPKGEGPTVLTCEILSGDAVTGTQDPATFMRCHKPSYPRVMKASLTMTPAHGPEDVQLPLSQQDGWLSHFEGEKGSLFYPCQRWQPQLQNGWVS